MAPLIEEELQQLEENISTMYSAIDGSVLRVLSGTASSIWGLAVTKEAGIIIRSQKVAVR